MKFNKKDLLDNFELYLGGIFITVTVCLVIMNVFTRYVLKFTFIWAEEISVACFVWTIFWGAAGAFKHKSLMGVDFLLQITKGKARTAIQLFSNLLVAVCSTAMFFMSIAYVMKSKKITAALMISYKWINISIPIAFALISIYSIVNLIKYILVILNKDSKKAIIKEEQ